MNESNTSYIYINQICGMLSVIKQNQFHWLWKQMIMHFQLYTDNTW